MIYFYVSLITYICYCMIKYRESLYYLIKDKYDNKKYKKRICKEYRNIFITPELLTLFLIPISLLLNIKVLEICMIIIYALLFLNKLKTNNKEIKKEKKLTIRKVIIILIYIMLNIWFYIDYKTNYGEERTLIYYTVLALTTYLSYIIVYIVNIISKPFDKHLK